MPRPLGVFCYTKAMNKYWFRKRQGLKSKDLGWGWVPISWEGWTLVLLFVAFIFASGYLLFADNIARNTNPSLTTIFIYLGVVVASIGVVSLVSSKKTQP